ncbi:MAG: hypothetical protein IT285_12305 [Bdellovibrionales bacterium]|nr:hypothetical protein [Bdellovibrionales bacterium]
MPSSHGRTPSRRVRHWRNSTFGEVFAEWRGLITWPLLLGAVAAWGAALQKFDAQRDSWFALHELHLEEPERRTPASVGEDLETRFLSGVQCADQALETLQEWSVERSWVLKPSAGLDGSVSLLSPTRTVGVWAEAQVFLNKEVLLRRITPSRIKTLTFDLRNCARNPEFRTVVRQFDPRVMGAAFTDHDLIRLLREQTRGAVYVWSPAMPYSYNQRRAPGGHTGIQEAREAAEALSLHLTVLVDPAASPLHARDIVRATEGMSDDMLRRVESIEFLYRAMGNHYPAMLVYSGRRIARIMYPGRGTVAEYRAYMEEQLKLLEGGR